MRRGPPSGETRQTVLQIRDGSPRAALSLSECPTGSRREPWVTKKTCPTALQVRGRRLRGCERLVRLSYELVAGPWGANKPLRWSDCPTGSRRWRWPIRTCPTVGQVSGKRPRRAASASMAPSWRSHGYTVVAHGFSCPWVHAGACSTTPPRTVAVPARRPLLACVNTPPRTMVVRAPDSMLAPARAHLLGPWLRSARFWLSRRLIALGIRLRVSGGRLRPRSAGCRRRLASIVLCQPPSFVSGCYGVPSGRDLF